MTSSRIDPTTGDLLVGGKPVFPLGLSDPPPVASTAPNSGLPAWTEIVKAGVTHVRNYTVWAQGTIPAQLAAVSAELDAARKDGLQLWLALAGLDRDLSKQSLLDEVVDAIKGHPGLGVWKGIDEPALSRVPVAGLTAVYKRLRALDPNHPVAIIEAPRVASSTPGRTAPLTAAAVEPYAAACDIHGIDIYPVSVPPGAHAGGPPVNTDISVVGDVTGILVRASGHRPIWTTLQIAWSGVLPPHPLVFPTLQQARFMAYDAIIAGARGLFFFGGQIKAAMNAADQKRGWNWTYWEHVQRPLLVELGDPSHTAALLAPAATAHVTANVAGIAVAARRHAQTFNVIAVNRSATHTGTVRFSGLPTNAGHGTCLAHPGNPARPMTAHAGAFTDPAPFAPHNARVYAFPLPG